MTDSGRRVAVTGAAGYISGRLIERLERDDSVAKILATDICPMPGPCGPKVEYLRHEVTTSMGSILADHGIDSMVHLAYVVRPRRDRKNVREVDVDGTARVLEACDRAGVEYFLYLSSSSVYGAHPDNPALLTEDAKPRPLKGFQYAEDKVETERLILEYDRLHPNGASAILRGCPVLGPHADNFVAKAFKKPVLAGFVGHDPPMQFVHEDDLAELMAQCLLKRVSGLFNVAGNCTIRWSEMARIRGRPRIQLPAPLLYTLARVSWALKLQSDSTAVGLNFARFPWSVSTEKIQEELGFTFNHSSREVWEEFAAQ